MPTEKMFPIQADHGRHKRSAGSVPWSVAEVAYQTYSKLYGSNQSLERLAERGGFGWSELVNLIQGKSHLDFTSLSESKVVE